MLLSTAIAITSLFAMQEGDYYSGLEYIKQIGAIRDHAPKALPAGVPTALLEFTRATFSTENGTYEGGPGNLGTMIATGWNGSETAYIVAAYRTTTTPSTRPTLEGANVPPTYQTNAPAAQVYECRNTNGSFAWTFIRPEAGLTPITTQPVTTSVLHMDHFRHPGVPSKGIPAGPGWRVMDRFSTFGRDHFIGALEVSVPNGAANIPLLRLRAVPERLGESTAAFPWPPDPEYFENFDGFVLRLNTKGGLAPTTGCAKQADVGKTHRSPYSADYYFVQVVYDYP
jgi:Protein of unknown function (DUF3455)